MFSKLLKELEDRLRAATIIGDAKDFILPGLEPSLRAHTVQNEQSKLMLQKAYQGRKPWTELPELVYNVLKPFSKILDTLWSKDHGDLLSTAVANINDSPGFIRILYESTQSDESVVVPRTDVTQIVNVLDALEAPLSWLDDLHSELSVLLEESSQHGQHPSLLSLISDLTNAAERCNDICRTPDFTSAYDKDDQQYKRIIAAEEFYQREYDEHSAPNYFKNCEKSRERGLRLTAIRDGSYFDFSTEVFSKRLGGSIWDIADYEKALKWKFAIDTDNNVLDWTYPPVKDWSELRGEGESVVDVTTGKWLKGEWGPAEKLATDMETWAAIQRQANVTGHILMNTAKCLEIVHKATSTIHGLSMRLSTALRDLFYNIACDAPRSIIQTDVKEVQKLHSVFQASHNLLRTYKDPWIDTSSWTGKTTLYSFQKPVRNIENNLIFGISCMDAPPNHNIRIDSQWNPERGPYPDCWLYPPFQADVEWLELPDGGRGMDHNSMGWGRFADHGNETEIGVGRKSLSRYIDFRKEAVETFVESGKRPTVVAWIRSMETNSDYQCQITVYADEISQKGFRLHADAGTNSELIGIRVGWLAYSAECRSLWSLTTHFSKKGLHSAPSGSGRMGWGQACNMPRTVPFAEQFELPPRTIGLISTIDADKRYAVRIKSRVVKVTKDCVRLHGDSWDNTKANDIGITFVGRGAPTTY